MLAHINNSWLQFLNWGDGSRMRFGHNPRNSDRTGFTLQPTDETGRHVGFAEMSWLQGDLAFGDTFDEPNNFHARDVVINDFLFFHIHSLCKKLATLLIMYITLLDRSARTQL